MRLRRAAPQGSTTTLFRITTEDVVVRDQPIARGSMICLLLPGANLDAEVFPDPEKFDISRANANKHLGLVVAATPVLAATGAD